MHWSGPQEQAITLEIKDVAVLRANVKELREVVAFLNEINGEAVAEVPMSDAK